MNCSNKIYLSKKAQVYVLILYEAHGSIHINDIFYEYT